jgi:prepilin-type N-terminal cleavage/methylation domain-containing protein
MDSGYRKGELNPKFEQAFTLLELLIVISVICSLIALLIPVTSIVRDSTKHQKARSVVSQLIMGLNDYACEDPSRSMPPSDADHLVHSDPTGASFHILDAMIAMHLDGGLHPLVADPGNSQLRTLIDPWRRPYRYQLDTGGAIDWNNVVQPIRPDPARSDWNAKNQVPFGYVWSLGRPAHGTSGQWLMDPDAAAGSGAPWIYLTTSPAGTTP